MGPSNTLNSATLVNKGLELIEAHLLFGTGLDQIAVVVHPQSIVHSMVEFTDGATLAMASPPDMRLPIALALAWPDRVPDATPALDWTQAATWTFEPLDDDAFPAVRLARAAAAAPRPRSTTRPTRSAWTPSWPARSRSPGSWTPWPR
jgi:1-deoxy-D-xylulose-5-phosphate reductoisomerase